MFRFGDGISILIFTAQAEEIEFAKAVAH